MHYKTANILAWVAYITGLLLLVIAGLFKIMHWPGSLYTGLAGLILVSGTIAVRIYLWKKEKKKTFSKNKKTQKITHPVTIIFGMLSVGLIFTGSLMKVFHLPYARIFLVAGLFMVICWFVVEFYIRKNHQPAHEDILDYTDDESAKNEKD